MSPQEQEIWEIILKKDTPYSIIKGNILAPSGTNMGPADTEAVRKLKEAGYDIG